MSTRFWTVLWNSLWPLALFVASVLVWHRWGFIIGLAYLVLLCLVDRARRRSARRRDVNHITRGSQEPMSTHYQIRCLTCGGERYDLDNSNHCGNEALGLLRLRAELSSLGRAVTQAPQRTADLRRLFGWDIGHLLRFAEWLPAHDGHTLAVFDEYELAFPRKMEP